MKTTITLPLPYTDRQFCGQAANPFNQGPVDYPEVLKTTHDSSSLSLTSVLSVVWNEASKEIQSSTKLLYAEKGKTEDTEEVELTPRSSKVKTKR